MRMTRSRYIYESRQGVSPTIQWRDPARPLARPLVEPTARPWLDPSRRFKLGSKLYFGETHFSKLFLSLRKKRELNLRGGIRNIGEVVFENGSRLLPPIGHSGRKAGRSGLLAFDGDYECLDFGPLVVSEPERARLGYGVAGEFWAAPLGTLGGSVKMLGWIMKRAQKSEIRTKRRT